MNDLTSQGIELMLLGMGTVFVFLVVLIFATSFMSRVIMSIDSRRVEPEPAEYLNEGSSIAQAPDQRLLKIITEAVKQHRSKR